ncbi:elongation factor G [Synechococcus sp. PCC 7336]|uniref:elongation factor G n=1 Tax=Synechococcus sp. PCC 7336 TaxID=195250 RepID=UPI000475B61B|nr:elongation factor G [Synechococcus sp. PCC 7336]
MNGRRLSDSRNIAIVGPYSSGKTTVLESLLSVTGTITRKGAVTQGNTVGDGTPEARNRQMSTEVNVASAEYGDILFNFLDCPGSIELGQETYNALVGVDLAIVVCEPDQLISTSTEHKAVTLALLFQFLDDWEIPHLVLINKMDRIRGTYVGMLKALKSVSRRPVIPQQYPIRQGNDVVGFIDLVDEQAYHYHSGAPADPVPLPDELKAEEREARQEMLETLADFDDRLMEELLEDIDPPQAEIEQDLKQELGEDAIVPVFIGISRTGFGTRPLLDALVREAPEPSVAAERRGLKGTESGEPLVQVLKTYYTQQGGKLSLVRVWQGTLRENSVLNGSRAGGLYQLMGQQQRSLQQAAAGTIVALSRLDTAATGDVLSTIEVDDELLQADRLEPVFALAIAPENRKDEVKLSGALTKLVEEDPSLHWEHHGDTHEVMLWGQGNIHLQIALDRLRTKFNLPMDTHMPHVSYRETIRKPRESVHGRYKRQSGGHGQFGDVYVDIQPLPRGKGNAFDQKIVGGAVPKQYIPGVESGVREYLQHGPLGFPVVDVAVTLKDGSYHSVDSSEQAFKQAARLAMQAGMPECDPQLLEPIDEIEVSVPSEFTSNVLGIISGRRGQILGYNPRTGWTGWDVVSAYMPEAEMQTLIVELRSQTLGVATFSRKYDRLQEVPDKLKERILAEVNSG